MSVLVKGMEMPKNCGGCPLRASCVHRIYLEYRPDYCPLIGIPPHGRLIDADAAYEQFLNLMDTQGAINPCQLGTILVDATTIIEAEEGENG